MSLLALVHVHDILAVDRQVLVWVNHHTEKTRVCLNETEDYSQKQVFTQF